MKFRTNLCTNVLMLILSMITYSACSNDIYGVYRHIDIFADDTITIHLYKDHTFKYNSCWHLDNTAVRGSFYLRGDTLILSSSQFVILDTLNVYSLYKPDYSNRKYVDSLILDKLAFYFKVPLDGHLTLNHEDKDYMLWDKAKDCLIPLTWEKYIDSSTKSNKIYYYRIPQNKKT